MVLAVVMVERLSLPPVLLGIYVILAMPIVLCGVACLTDRANESKDPETAASPRDEAAR
jgi:hypothetical protein